MWRSVGTRRRRKSSTQHQSSPHLPPPAPWHTHARTPGLHDGNVDREQVDSGEVLQLVLDAQLPQRVAHLQLE